MLTKKEFEKSIVYGIKAGRLDPCNSVEIGDVYTDRPQYYWTVEDDEVVEESPIYSGDKQPQFRFGVSFGDIEGYTEKDFGELSADEAKQAMLSIIDEYGIDNWYDQYLEEA